MLTHVCKFVTLTTLVNQIIIQFITLSLFEQLKKHYIIKNISTIWIVVEKNLLLYTLTQTAMALSTKWRLLDVYCHFLQVYIINTYHFERRHWTTEVTNSNIKKITYYNLQKARYINIKECSKYLRLTTILALMT